MMKWVFGILIAASVVSGLVLGRADELTGSVLSEGVSAIELGMFLMGGMCVWGGIMRVADKAGLTSLLARLFRLPARLLFRGLDLNGTSPVATGGTPLPLGRSARG